MSQTFDSFVGDFFAQQKDEIRQALMQEIEPVIDRLMNSMATRFTKIISDQISTGQCPFQIVPIPNNYLPKRQIPESPILPSVVDMQNTVQIKEDESLIDEVEFIPAEPTFQMSSTSQDAHSNESENKSADNSIQDYIDIDDDDEEEEEDDCNCEDCTGLLVKSEEEEEEDLDVSISQQGIGRPVKRQKVSQNQIPDLNSSNAQQMPKSINLNERKHRGNATNGRMLSLNCTISGCTFTSRDNVSFNLHLLKQHNILPHRCYQLGCNRSFHSKGELHEHFQRDHYDVQDWQCNQCQHFLKTAQLLSRHNRMIHETGEFQCTFPGCLFVANRRATIHQHYRRGQHEAGNNSGNSERPIITCSFPGCGKTFAQAANLRTHERFHLGIKPYRCKWEGCSYACEHQSDCIKHIRIKHFHLPRTIKVQNELNIVDFRNPRIYMETLDELLNR